MSGSKGGKTDPKAELKVELTEISKDLPGVINRASSQVMKEGPNLVNCTNLFTSADMVQQLVDATNRLNDPALAKTVITNVNTVDVPRLNSSVSSCKQEIRRLDQKLNPPA